METPERSVQHRGNKVFYNGSMVREGRKYLKTPERSVEEIVEDALDLLHECIQHTPIKLSETNGTEYDKGYIAYQDMVVRDVLDNTPKLKALFDEAVQAERQKREEMVEAEKQKTINYLKWVKDGAKSFKGDFAIQQVIDHLETLTQSNNK